MPRWKAQDTVELVEIAAGLHRISGARGALHAYFLQSESGNVLFCAPDRMPFFREHARFFDEHGGIDVQALTHHGDASRASAYVAKTWSAPVCINEWDRALAERESGLEIETGFANDSPLLPGVDGIHLPGHSAGFSGFRCVVGAKSYLIIGHGVRQLPTHGGWAIATGGPLIDVALRTLDKRVDLEIDFLLVDNTRWGGEPPLLFDKNARLALRDSARSYLLQKRDREAAAAR